MSSQKDRRLFRARRLEPRKLVYDHLLDAAIFDVEAPDIQTLQFIDRSSQIHRQDFKRF